MFKEYFVLLLLAHIAGDFYVQTGNMAKKKEEDVKWVTLHCLCYLAAVMIVSVPVMSYNVAVYGILFAVTHMVIDLVKFYYIRRLKKKAEITPFMERNIFFADQGLHFICLAAVAYLFASHGNALQVGENAAVFFETVGGTGKAFASWSAALLIIHKPANIAISKLLMIYKPANLNDEENKDNNAGRFIGTVERILILIFISIEQFSAIGLVLTAKSIARYDRISKEKDFAEYYLLGTLLSVVVVIVVSFILF